MFNYTIKVVDLNNKFDDTIPQNDAYGVAQILCNLHGKFYNHYGKNYMKWISVTVVDKKGEKDYIQNLVKDSTKYTKQYFDKKG